MNLTLKTLLVLAGIFVLLMTMNYAVLKTQIFPSYVELEQAEAQRNLNRALDAFNNEMNHLSSLAFDWAAWDDSYKFVKDHNKKYQASNLLGSSFVNNKLNMILFLRTTGEVVWGKIYDLKKAKWIKIKQFSVSRLPSDHVLLKHNGLKSAPVGFANTEHGPMVVASRPIIKSNQTGPIRGTIVMGFFLTDRLKKIQRQTKVSFKIWAIGDDRIPEVDREALRHIGSEHRIWTRVHRDETRSVYGTLPDARGKPVLLVRADTPRNITEIGAQTLRATNIGVILAGIAAMLLLALLFRVLITGPLTAMKNHVLAISNSADLSKRLTFRRRDEIGILAREFDNMVENLATARGQLQEQSYQSGIAEMASGVLHNVRNQLNPLVLRLGRIRQMLPPQIDENVETAFNELASDQTSAERKQKLLEYVKLSVDNLMSRQYDLHSEVDAISRQLGRVEEVVAEQDRFSHRTRVIEPTKLADAVRRAIGMMPDDVGKNIAVEVDTGIESFAPVLAESFVLTHVIQNLLMNGADAIHSDGTASGKIEIKVQMHTPSGGIPMADLQVQDNGAGIDADKLETIFERGYSSKEGKKGGTGLHWCANSLAGMNGRIYAESAGPHQGAIFHVLLPVSSEVVETAA